MPGEPDKICLIFFADSHLGFDYAVKPRIERRRRGDDFFNNYKKILQYAELTRPDFLIHGGDFFFRSKVPAKIIELSYTPLNSFVNRTGIPVFIVPGNHERSVLPDSPLLIHPLIHIFKNPESHLLRINNITVQICGFPFVRNNIRDNFKNILQQSSWQSYPADVRLLCMHQAIEGAKVGPSDYTFKSGQDVLPIKSLPDNASAVLSGHIHRKQILYKNHIPIIYPGSIERTSFAEKDEEKGFYQIIIEADNNYKFKVAHIKFLRLPSRPMINYTITPVKTADEAEFMLKDLKSHIPDNAIIRFMCKSKPDEHFKKIFSSSLIRKTLPSSVNFQFGNEFYNKRTHQKEADNHS